MSKLVIVESPTKAKTIEKYLPSGYVVRASVGHIRDLPDKKSQMPEKLRKEPWAYLGVDITKDFDPVYVVKDARSKKAISELKKLLADSDELILATDEDREGEAIGWHLIEVLKPKVPVKRMVFHEITKTAIQKALEQTRDVDQALVEAQEARRILDRLVGYPLSLLIGKKIRYGLSAGRVQSVATRLLVMRERERRRFKIGTYWDLKGMFDKAEAQFEATLHSVDGTRIATGKDFDENTGKIAEGKKVLLIEEDQARQIEKDLAGRDWNVADVQEKPYQTSPKPPFTTSTLQQEASRKLGLSARDTMRVAQSLYEQGFITYMRTDSVNLSQQAIDAARGAAKQLFGDAFVPDQPRRYKGKAKGAQEAHEAIRPSGDAFQTPARTGLSGREFQLYELIWKRTVACQMVNARMTGIRADLNVTVDGVTYLFRANGKRIDFPGYLRAYVEGKDDPDARLEDQENPLPEMKAGETAKCTGIEAIGHQTKPPARYTEASLVKALEEAGIGRPSTYAAILNKIVYGSEYARKQGKTLVPTYTAFAATALLENHFKELVDLEFTAKMEDDLDAIASGDAGKVDYLHQFYRQEGGFADRIEAGEKDIDPGEAREVKLKDFPVTMKVGRFGPYVQIEEDGETKTANVPQEVPPADLSVEVIKEQLEKRAAGPEVLGECPETGKKVYLMQGPYGPYVQLGETPPKAPKKKKAAKKKKAKAKKGAKKKAAAKKVKVEKPKRSSIPKGEDPSSVSLDRALQLLSLPRTLGEHPETKKAVQTGLGRFGPYVKHESDFRSLKNPAQLFELTLEEALEIFKQPKRRRQQKIAKELGNHPRTGKPLNVLEGKYGPYIKWGLKNITLPKDIDLEKLTVEQAVKIIDEAKGKPKKKAAGKK